MKKMRIKNGEYAVKKLAQIVVASRKGALVKHKEAVVFKSAFAAVWYTDGECECYTSGRNQESTFSVLYYDSDDATTKILFPEESEEWKKLFIYLSDEHGAFLLIACRRMEGYLKPHCRWVSRSDVSELRKETLQELGVIDDRLLERMLDMERNQSDDDEEVALLYER